MGVGYQEEGSGKRKGRKTEQKWGVCEGRVEL